MPRLQRMFLAIAMATGLSSYCSAQLPRITLIQKNYEYYNMSTGGSTSDWSHSFVVEGEKKARKAGYFGQHLRKYLESDSVAVGYMKQYAAKQTVKLASAASTNVGPSRQVAFGVKFNF